jgi:Ankyrin repeat
MPERVNGNWLARAFWIVACGDVLLFLFWLLQVENSPGGEFSGLIVFFLLVLFGLAGIIIGIVALIRRPTAYRIGLALLVVPVLWWGTLTASNFLGYLISPSAESRRVGDGYFTAPEDRALAHAVVAGDAAQVAALAPTANPNAIGWNGMTFLRLAMDQGHPSPAVVAALLRAGADPDQDDNQLLFGIATRSYMTDGKDPAMLRAIIGTGVDLNHFNSERAPRFFSGLNWPEGLTLMLEHGADPQAEDAGGYTAMMYAVLWRRWPCVDVLLAHGARVDHVGHDGKSMRDIVAEAHKQLIGDPPPQLAAVEARLR